MFENGKKRNKYFFLLILIYLPFSASCQTSRNNAGFFKCKSLKTPADMKCIPGGAFTRGSNKKSHKLCCTARTGMRVRDEYPEQKIILSTYFIDTYEVTYGQYQLCIKKGACSSKGQPHYLWVKRKPKGPMLGMNWYHARDYCRWHGKTLPSEAQWEKAARGPDGAEYPWDGTSPDCKNSIIHATKIRGCGTHHTWAVGSRPPGRYGLYDMVGNAHEWVNDWYTPSYQKCGAACQGKDPMGPCNGKDKCKNYKMKIVKGGSWYWPGIYARAAHRRPHYAINTQPYAYHHFGFRCARLVNEKNDVK